MDEFPYEDRSLQERSLAAPEASGGRVGLECLSVKRVDCDKTKQQSVDISTPYDTAMFLVS